MRLIIDTDTAGDDVFSILLALRQPGVTLEALTICNGNVGFEQQIENALYTLEQAGRSWDVPVFAGCPRPMLRNPQRKRPPRRIRVASRCGRTNSILTCLRR